MSREEILGIVLLMCVSLIVRIVPALAPLPAFLSKQDKWEKIAPIAVLLNLGIYCTLSEIQSQPLPASIGMAVLAALFLAFRRCSILLTLGLASLAFFATVMLR